MIAVLADLLSLMRVLAAGLLVWLGLTRGAGALPEATLVAIFGWTTDAIDGFAARHAGRPTRLGKLDFLFDVLLYAGILTYLTLSGYLPAVPAVLYALIAVAVSVGSHRKEVAVLFLRLIDLACLLVLFRYSKWAGILIVGWLVILAIVYRRRIRVGVPRWLSQLADLVSGHRG